MPQEYFWFGLILLVTALMWMPYILSAFFTWGILKTLTYDEKVPALPIWAQRAKKAHANAIENLALFAPAVIGFWVIAPAESQSILLLLQIYFFARLAHYVLYIVNVPFGRTVTFLTGWAVTVCIIWKIVSIS